MSSPLMGCGHSANAKVDGKPCCVICLGLDPGATIIAEEQPNLEGRMARCSYCGKGRESKTGLAFFRYCPEETFDRFYCGCRGWD